MSFALQVELKGGGTHHLFGSTPEQRAEFEAMAAGWQDQPLNGYYLLTGEVGRDCRIYVRDIADVRVVTS